MSSQRASTSQRFVRSFPSPSGLPVFRSMLTSFSSFSLSSMQPTGDRIQYRFESRFTSDQVDLRSFFSPHPSPNSFLASFLVFVLTPPRSSVFLHRPTAKQHRKPSLSSRTAADRGLSRSWDSTGGSGGIVLNISEASSSTSSVGLDLNRFTSCPSRRYTARPLPPLPLLFSLMLTWFPLLPIDQQNRRTVRRRKGISPFRCFVVLRFVLLLRRLCDARSSLNSLSSFFSNRHQSGSRIHRDPGSQRPRRVLQTRPDSPVDPLEGFASPLGLGLCWSGSNVGMLSR